VADHLAPAPTKVMSVTRFLFYMHQLPLSDWGCRQDTHDYATCLCKNLVKKFTRFAF
jgi:hypothetical protein